MIKSLFIDFLENCKKQIFRTKLTPIMTPLQSYKHHVYEEDVPNLG